MNNFNVIWKKIAIFFLVGIFLIIFGTSMFVKSVRDHNNSVLVDAVVLDDAIMYWDQIKECSRYCYSCSYEYEGVSYTTVINISSPFYEKGENIKIYILKDNPSKLGCDITYIFLILDFWGIICIVVPIYICLKNEYD